METTRTTEEINLALMLIESQKESIKAYKSYDFTMHKIIDMWLELLADDQVEMVMKSMERRLNDYKKRNPNDVI